MFAAQHSVANRIRPPVAAARNDELPARELKHEQCCGRDGGTDRGGPERDHAVDDRLGHGPVQAPGHDNQGEKQKRRTARQGVIHWMLRQFSNRRHGAGR